MQVTLETGSLLAMSWHPSSWGQVAVLGSKDNAFTCSLGDRSAHWPWSAALQLDRCNVQLRNDAAGKAASTIITCPDEPQAIALGDGPRVLVCATCACRHGAGAEPLMQATRKHMPQQFLDPETKMTS